MLLAVGTYAQTDVWRTDSLQEVVVTGTGTRHLLKDAPVQTEVITSKMLSQYGGKSLEDILAGLTASFAFNEGDMGSQMQLNGLGNNYILVLIDGKRIHGDVGGENDLSLIDPHNIEKTEVVKGAQLLLDYTGTAKCGPVTYDGVTYVGTIDASTHPEFVTGGGTLEAVPLGTVVIVR